MKDQIVTEMAQRIILEEFNNQIAFNIMDLENLKEIWEKLISIYNEIS